MVPLAEMFGYVNNLRSMSQGAQPTRCISIITIRCRRWSRTRFARRWPDDEVRTDDVFFAEVEICPDDVHENPITEMLRDGEGEI